MVSFTIEKGATVRINTSDPVFDGMYGRVIENRITLDDINIDAALYIPIIVFVAGKNVAFYADELEETQ